MFSLLLFLLFLYGKNFTSGGAPISHKQLKFMCNGPDAIAVRDSHKKVSLAMLSRSKKYLEALYTAELLFTAQKLQRFHHDGTHFYYECLLALNDLQIINDVPDIAAVSIETWKAILRGGGQAAVEALMDGERMEALEADGDAGDDYALALPAPMAAPMGSQTAEQGWIQVTGAYDVRVRLRMQKWSQEAFGWPRWVFP